MLNARNKNNSFNELNKKRIKNAFEFIGDKKIKKNKKFLFLLFLYILINILIKCKKK